MPLTATRVYKNSSEDTLRIDTLYLDPKRDVICTGIRARTFNSIKETQTIYESTDRVVATIQLITDADEVDTAGFPSAAQNYTYCKWTAHSAILDMSDLPVIGDTI